MPKPSLDPSATVTTVAEVQLSPKLKKRLSMLLARYQARHAEIATLEAMQEEAKDAMETAFADAGEYDALKAGVRVDDIPLKRIEGQETTVTDYPGIMKKFKITPKAWAAFQSKRPKKGYLSVSLPRKKKDADDDDEK